MSRSRERCEERRRQTYGVLSGTDRFAATGLIPSQRVQHPARQRPVPPAIQGPTVGLRTYVPEYANRPTSAISRTYHDPPAHAQHERRMKSGSADYIIHKNLSDDEGDKHSYYTRPRSFSSLSERYPIAYCVRRRISGRRVIDWRSACRGRRFSNALASAQTASTTSQSSQEIHRSMHS